MHRSPVHARFVPCVVAALLVLTVLLRFVALDARPVMHDESLFAYYAYAYFEKGSYTHSPILHGPTLMLAVGKLFALFGDSIVVARAFIAVMSLVMLASMLVLAPRRYRLWFTLLLITSPVLLYYSRFLRDDVLFSAVLMLGMAGFALALSRRRHRGVRAAGAAFGVFMFMALAGIMENAVFVYATGASFLLLLAAKRYAWDGRRRCRCDNALRPGIDGGEPNTALGAGEASGSEISRRRERWIAAAGWFTGLLLGLAYLAFVYGITLGPSYQDAARLAVAGDAPEVRRAIFLKTLDLTWPEQANVTVRLMADSWRNVKESWDYWLGQHKLHRIAGPSHYYLPILLVYELPICLLLLAGLAWDACLRRRRTVLYGATVAAWVALWLIWKSINLVFVLAWLAEVESFLHLAPDASALILGLVIAPVLVWSMLCLREHRVLAAWMGWWLACSLFQYSSAGEKVPWLSVHIVLPLYLTVVWLWAPRLRRMGWCGRRSITNNGAENRRMGGRRFRTKLFAVGVIAPFVVVGASLLALRNDIPLIGSRSADPAERIVYNHTTPWFHRALQGRVGAWKAKQATVPLKQRRAVLAGNGVWPAIWYLRHTSYQLVEGGQKVLAVPEGTDLVIGEPEQLVSMRAGGRYAPYVANEGSLRDGWIETWPDHDRWSVLWRYYWHRELWTPRSTFPIVIMDPVLVRH